MSQATLSKWGNSQGVRIPREYCDLLGARVGDTIAIEYDSSRNALVLSFDKPGRKYQRNRKMSLEEFVGEWSGGKVGEEIPGDVGEGPMSDAGEADVA